MNYKELNQILIDGGVLIHISQIGGTPSYFKLDKQGQLNCYSDVICRKITGADMALPHIDTLQNATGEYTIAMREMECNLCEQAKKEITAVLDKYNAEIYADCPGFYTLSVHVGSESIDL